MLSQIEEAAKNADFIEAEILSETSYEILRHGALPEPLSPLNGMSTSAFSEYTPVGTVLNEVVKAAFPADTLLSDNASVIQTVGIVFFVQTAGDEYLAFSGCSMIVYDVF